MISQPDYKVMGEDCKEYGPVAGDQIRKWIADARLERKTPVKSSESPDWVFLEALPEFADAFHPPTPPPKTKPRKWLVVIVITLAAGLIWLALKKFNTH
jgi:hypothetical protein